MKQRTGKLRVLLNLRSRESIMKQGGEKCSRIPRGNRAAGQLAV
jgi:hypothetical protein